jgi:DNA-binding MarR family transcriptional regulator
MQQRQKIPNAVRLLGGEPMQDYDLSFPDAISGSSLPVLLRVGPVPGLEAMGHRFRILDDTDDHGWLDAAVVRPGAASAGLVAHLLADDVPLILVAADDEADAAGALLGGAVRAFLPPDAGETALADALTQALARGDGVHDRGNWVDPRILALKEEADRVAAAVAALADEREPGAPRGIDAPRIRAHIRARRQRERFFAPSLFADPAWDILLDLAAARLEGRLVSVSSLCIAAAVPTTTALRWVKNLLDIGLLVRSDDPADARRAFITLAPATAATMDRCLESVFNTPGL